MAVDIVMCAKSSWIPTIRREHSLAMAAVHLGHSVEFVEQADDIRSILRKGVPAYLRGLSGTVNLSNETQELIVRSRSTLLPGHRNRLACAVDAVGLRRALGRSARMAAPPRAVVVNAPWNWPGVSYTRGRRVADLADDWRILIPARRTHLENLYRRIENEADEIVVASVELKSLFHREVVVVPNAVAPELLARPLTIPPRERRMVYLGTLSERFDARLMTDVLRILPDWKLDLYGPCQYRGHGGEPNHELAELLTTFRHQVRWHGPLSRVAISDRLDAADVLVIPNNVGLTKGQDSMKLYDYAARGRPIVATILSAAGSGPPGAAAHESAEEFADAVRAGLDDPAPLPHARREWAETNTWDRRVGPWLAAVLGPAA